MHKNVSWWDLYTEQAGLMCGSLIYSNNTTVSWCFQVVFTVQWSDGLEISVKIVLFLFLRNPINCQTVMSCDNAQHFGVHVCMCVCACESVCVCVCVCVCVLLSGCIKICVPPDLWSVLWPFSVMNSASNVNWRNCFDKLMRFSTDMQACSVQVEMIDFKSHVGISHGTWPFIHCIQESKRADQVGNPHVNLYIARQLFVPPGLLV